MDRFTVRVQLHGADEGDDAYDTLHAQMKKRGFVRTIDGSDSTSYDLPWGSYNYVGERTIEQVLDRAKDAASTTGYKAGILVTEGARKWHGLKHAS
jgi:hypothetical protein